MGTSLASRLLFPTSPEAGRATAQEPPLQPAQSQAQPLSQLQEGKGAGGGGLDVGGVTIHPLAPHEQVFPGSGESI